MHQSNLLLNIAWIIEWIFLESISSNEYFLNYRMNFVRIIERMLLKLWNEYCLNCSINVGQNQMHIKANLSSFATSSSNVLNKIKYIWILLSIFSMWKLSNAYTQHQILTHFGNHTGLRFTLSLQSVSYTDRCVFVAAILNSFSNLRYLFTARTEISACKPT